MSEDIVDELNFYAQRAEADEKVLRLLAEAAGTIQRLRIPMTPGDMFNGLVSSLNYDGTDTASLTLGEIARAVDGAMLAKPEPKPYRFPDPRGPFFSTKWEREDYERRQRGEPELGPRGARP